MRNVEFSDAEAIKPELVKTPVQMKAEQVQTSNFKIFQLP